MTANIIGHVTIQDLRDALATVRVFLNGKEISHTLEADTVEGWLRRYKLDEKGMPYLAHPHDPAPVTETLHGLVTIRIGREK